MNCDTDIRYLKGVGEKRALTLYKSGIDTVGALLRFYPRAYEDWSKHRLIGESNDGEKVCVKARVTTPIEEKKIRQNMTVYKFIAEDASGAPMSVTIFNNRFLAARIHNGSEYLFYGKITRSLFLPEMSSPEISEVSSAGIHPIYRASSTLSSKTIAGLVSKAIFCDMEDPLPEEIRLKCDLCDLRFAIENIHFPRSQGALLRAKRRLVFEELFLLQTALLLMKRKKRALTGSVLEKDCSKDFEKLLPFGMTRAQKRVVHECIADMKSGRMMNRLIQGDVGSGKTAVAASLCYTAAKNGLQSAIMVPTEILAEQHFATITSFLENSGIECVLLTGSMKKSLKNTAKQKLASGEAMVVVGTHALLTEDVSFESLGLVITDEQHRFGVEQRACLAAKGENPHTCVMSATPIPRTLGLILYGDLDISIIDEYPRGRQKIDSFLVDSSYRNRIYNFIKKHLDVGRQGYIVCPLVSETENLDIMSAEEYFEDITNKEYGAFKDYKVGLLHGKMSAKAKDAVMRDFQSGEISLLVSTTVIEVGIDVPNATIMLIENAERFGLSQLHQLRGRIGRGKYLSNCIMISDRKSNETFSRLAVIRDNSDGFKIADEDLKLRGPGDFLGNRQHGLPDLKIADLSDDIEILHLAGQMSAELLKRDPTLISPENSALRKSVITLYKKMRSG